MDRLEIVARALCRADTYCDLDKPDGAEKWRLERDRYERRAQAAIEALEIAGYQIIRVLQVERQPFVFEEE